jgi:hypothetical protein
MFLEGYKETMSFSSLLEGLSRAIILNNIDNEYSIVMPATAKPVLSKNGCL